jgi:hypothetical protein
LLFSAVFAFFFLLFFFFFFVVQDILEAEKRARAAENIERGLAPAGTEGGDGSAATDDGHQPGGAGNGAAHHDAGVCKWVWVLCVCGRGRLLLVACVVCVLV